MYTIIGAKQIEELRAMVASDRISTGDSVRDLHARDQSRYAPCRLEVVIWPLDRNEVSGILAYANRHRIPVTGWGSGSSPEGNPIPACRGGLIS